MAAAWNLSGSGAANLTVGCGPSLNGSGGGEWRRTFRGLTGILYKKCAIKWLLNIPSSSLAESSAGRRSHEEKLKTGTPEEIVPNLPFSRRSKEETNYVCISSV